MSSQQKNIGILLANIGTPEAPTTKAVRRYLNEFLSDPRVIALPQMLWQPILKGLILPFRAPRSAKLYQKIWTEDGSPLMYISKRQVENIQTYFSKNFSEYNFLTVLGMRYGNPSISNALHQLKENHTQSIIILPLFPQYSASTSASTLDAVNKQLKQWRVLPAIKFINHYYDNEHYINALARHINEYRQLHKSNNHLLFSFHGIPKDYVDNGDPYSSHCHSTARLLAGKLNLQTGQWSLAFQSRFGSKEWLKPYCVDVLKDLPHHGVKSLDIVCPGFAVDCLETLEEIAKTNREIFFNAGGTAFNYIPALNDSPCHTEALARIIAKHL